MKIKKLLKDDEKFLEMLEEMLNWRCEKVWFLRGIIWSEGI